MNETGTITKTELNEKDQATLNRLETTQANVEYIIKTVKETNSCKNIKVMLNLAIENLDRAKVILYNDKWYEWLNSFMSGPSLLRDQE